MKKLKFIIHPGLHKTGSSSIQLACQKNSSILFDCGLFYPSFGNKKWVNHSIPLSVMFMENFGERSHSVKSEFPLPEQRASAAKIFSQKFLDEVRSADGKDILISGEDISIFNESELSLFKLFLKDNFDCDIDVVIYVRNPIAFALSNAQELVRAKLYPLGDAIKIGGGNLQKIKTKIENFINVFGLDAVKVFCYDSVVGCDKNIVSHFMGHLKVYGNDLVFPRLNTSMSFEKTLILSAVQDQDKTIWDSFLKNSPSSGSKIIPGAGLVEMLWEASLSDRKYVQDKFKIEFLKFTDTSPSIDMYKFGYFLNTAKSINENIDFFDLVNKIISDIDDVFPEISNKIKSEKYLVKNNNFFELKCSNVRGRLGGFVDGKIYGWARFLNEDRPVKIDLLLNNVIIDSVFANQHRPDLAKKFNQDCAFFYELPNSICFPMDSHLRAVVSEENVELDNSPCTISV